MNALKECGVSAAVDPWTLTDVTTERSLRDRVPDPRPVKCDVDQGFARCLVRLRTDSNGGFSGLIGKQIQHNV